MAGVGPVPTPPGGVCDFPIYIGNLPLIPSKSPSVIVFTLAVGFYFLNGLWRDANMAGSDASNSLFATFTVLGLACAQTAVITSQASYFSRCPPVDWLGLVMAWVVGILGGSIGFWGAWAANGLGVTLSVKGKESFTTNSPFTLTSDALDLNSSGKSTAAASKKVPETCAVPGAPGNNTMIFEAVRNGVVDNTIIAEPIA